MEMRLRAPVTRRYFFLLGALPLVNAASPRNIDQKNISSGTQGKPQISLGSLLIPKFQEARWKIISHQKCLGPKST